MGQITRAEIHHTLDEALTKMGYGETLALDFGALAFEIKYEHGKVTLKVRERTTEVDLSKKL